MTERGYGKIINVSARAGLKGEAGLSAYCVSKGGVRTLTESLAAEVMDSGVNVNAIMPSIMGHTRESGSYAGRRTRPMGSTRRCRQGDMFSLFR